MINLQARKFPIGLILALALVSFALLPIGADLDGWQFGTSTHFGQDKVQHTSAHSQVYDRLLMGCRVQYTRDMGA